MESVVVPADPPPFIEGDGRDAAPESPVVGRRDLADSPSRISRRVGPPVAVPGRPPPMFGLRDGEAARGRGEDTDRAGDSCGLLALSRERD